jgi:hypothetical protein
MTIALRVLAIALAVAALIDPAWTAERPAPLALKTAGDPSHPLAAHVRSQLEDRLNSAVVTSGRADAVIAIDAAPSPALLTAGVPTHTVTASRPNVRALQAVPPPPQLRGRVVSLSADIEGSGVGGRTSTILVEQNGIEIARADHKWTADGVARVSVPVLPIAADDAGEAIVHVRALPFDDESRADDNGVDVKIRTVMDQLQIFVYEPRPSWTSGFVRRALEEDPAFAVSSLGLPSRGLTSRTPGAPTQLSVDALRRYDAVLVGAPEALRERDVEVLRQFMRVRGGAVVLLPDRRLTGPVTGLLPASGVDEVLLNAPSDVGGLKASELAPLREPSKAVEVVAATRDGKAVIAWWPEGIGRAVYSGALDAWRARAERESFSAFWRALVGSAAVASPPPLSVQVSPARARPGTTIRVTARVRPTEFVRDGERLSIPAVTAQVFHAGGVPIPVRLWPTADTGVLEGTFEAVRAGAYAMQIESPSLPLASTTFEVAPEAAGHAPSRDVLAAVASGTGGVAVDSADLAPLIANLAAHPRGSHAVPVHPTRSIWWASAFVVTLAVEWSLRRRRGLR